MRKPLIPRHQIEVFDEYDQILRLPHRFDWLKCAADQEPEALTIDESALPLILLNEFYNHLLGMTRMPPSPYSTPQSTPEGSQSFPYTKAALVSFLSPLIAAGSLLMIGPQILFLVPVAITTGIIFAVRRSFWSAVFFGYPLTFGLTVAWIGYHETPGYQNTLSFAVSIAIGLIGLGLTALGLWHSLPNGKTKNVMA